MRASRVVVAGKAVVASKVVVKAMGWFVIGLAAGVLFGPVCLFACIFIIGYRLSSITRVVKVVNKLADITVLLIGVGAIAYCVLVSIQILAGSASPVHYLGLIALLIGLLWIQATIVISEAVAVWVGTRLLGLSIDESIYFTLISDHAGSFVRKKLWSLRVRANAPDASSQTHLQR